MNLVVGRWSGGAEWTRTPVESVVSGVSYQGDQITQAPRTHTKSTNMVGTKPDGDEASHHAS